ncbi:amidohydrolase family protein [Achromobacter veterisilvae]|jgi:predicted TIM-barrel fold metal-dependent hydrolase|uniref:4-sulfomuconolactone hydrolase n=1 Tax=Achromobacter veterisilvae TaxID=2069367 RepID=A0A446CPE6_9BURK|nr:amidohydrolase family protein [Achromobacter veterisilvae]SSW69625.1 4-sulfomuconolactone hydrolase [Achromobacter veterisilvae]
MRNTGIAPGDLPQGSVDCHAHVIKKNLPLATERHSQPARDASVRDYLDTLTAHGVAYGLLTAPSFYGANNQVLLEALRASEGRLRGTAIVEPDIGEDALAAMQRDGVCGIRLNWVKRQAIPDIRSREYQGLLAKARNLGLHIEVYLEGEHLPPVLAAIRASGARAVIDHFGHPPGSDGERSEGFTALLDALAAGNTWVKLSAPFRLRGSDPRALAARIIQQSNGERAVWATDWPWVGHEDTMTYRQCIESLFECVPDETIRNRILTENAYEAFGIRA